MFNIRYLALAALCTGCPAAGDEVRPPRDQMYFPTAIAVSSAAERMFVTNANSDLRYDSGTILTFNLSKIADVISAWRTTGEVPTDKDCSKNIEIPSILECNENEFGVEEGSVRIGNFAADVKLQHLDDSNVRLFSTVRGDPSVTYADFDVAQDRLSCAGDSSFAECNDDHRITRMRNDDELSRITEEPFSLFVDEANGYVMVSHFSQGAVSLIEAPSSGDVPELSDAVGGLFNGNNETGALGAGGLAGRLPGSDSDLIYVVSRSESRVQTMSVQRPYNNTPVLIIGEYFFLDAVFPADDSRGISFSQDGQKAYVLNRNPAMLQVIDTSLSEFGKPRNQFYGGVEVCAQASGLTVLDSGKGERIYISCFRLGQVWVVDPNGLVVDAIIDVGRGPQGIAAWPEQKLIGVTNVLEDTVAWIDTAPASVTENRVVLRQGHARQDGGN